MPDRPSRANFRSDPRRVAEGFDRVAWCYPLLERFFLLPRWLQAAAREQLALDPGSRVLVVGCGLGRSLPVLSRAVGPGGEVVGIDISPVMARKAAARCRREGIGNAPVVCTDLFTFSDAEGFDRVWMEHSLNCFSDPQAALRKAWSLVRPNGRCVVLDGRLPPRYAWLTTRVMPAIRWVMEHSLLGDPDMDPSVEVERSGLPHRIRWSRGDTWFVATVEKFGNGAGEPVGTVHGG
jgi:ubiquinone/menaquinone biosynthesis C-methylase UbiE